MAVCIRVGIYGGYHVIRLTALVSHVVASLPAFCKQTNPLKRMLKRGLSIDGLLGLVGMVLAFVAVMVGRNVWIVLLPGFYLVLVKRFGYRLLLRFYKGALSEDVIDVKAVHFLLQHIDFALHL
jgi:hypothetical protein